MAQPSTSTLALSPGEAIASRNHFGASIARDYNARAAKIARICALQRERSAGAPGLTRPAFCVGHAHRAVHAEYEARAGDGHAVDFLGSIVPSEPQEVAGIQ